MAANRAPEGLGPSGRALWRRIESDLEEGLVFDAGEREILRQACHASDRLAEVRRDVRERGLWVTTPKGEIPNPLLIREESLQKTIAALVGKLQLSRPEPKTGHLSRAQRNRLRDVDQGRRYAS